MESRQAFEEPGQRSGHTLIEEDPHAGRSGFSETQLGVLEDCVYLLARIAREPGVKVIHAGTRFEVLEQRLGPAHACP